MYYADEIRPTKDIVPSRRPKVDKKELDMAAALIERFTSSFDHDQYEDEYRKRLLKVVKRKQKGEEIHVEEPPPEREEPADILEALRASVEAAKARRSSTGRRKSSTNGRTKSRRSAGRKRRTARARS